MQGIVGFITGLLTIGGLVLPLVAVMPRSRPQGELVAVVHEAHSRKPVTNASIELLTLQNAIITTLIPKEGGRARYTLKEGVYRLRVTHPKYTAQIRQILVQPGQRAEIFFALTPIAPPSRVVRTEKVGSVRKFFRDLGL